MHTVANLLQELEALLRENRNVDDGIAVQRPSLLAAHLLEQSLSGLKRAGSFYEDGLPRTHALQYLAWRVLEARASSWPSTATRLWVDLSALQPGKFEETFA